MKQHTDRLMIPEFEKIVRQVGSVVLGKEPQIRLALTCLFAKGHLLIEDLPGIGKNHTGESAGPVYGTEISAHAVHF